MTLSQDILAELAEISPDSPLAEARAVREEARRGSSKERPRTRPVREASARPPRPLLSG